MSKSRNISNSKELKEAIARIESEIKTQESDIKMNFTSAKENLNPKKVIKNTFSYVAEVPEIQRTLVNTVIGMVLGFASKKAVQLLSEDALNRTVENLVSYQMTKLENNQPNSLISKGISLFRKHTPPSSPLYPLLKYR
jgi:ElaB/YqjD/DUF883 family membrane-anchored ribosome-binding protein